MKRCSKEKSGRRRRSPASAAKAAEFTEKGPQQKKSRGKPKRLLLESPPQDVLLLLKFHFHLYPFISEFENNDINATTQGTSVARIRIYHV